MRVNYSMCVLKCPSAGVCCTLCVYRCLTQLITASSGCSEPGGQTSGSSFISRRDHPAGLGQEGGVNAGGYRRPLTWQTVFPVGSAVRAVEGEKEHGHHCLLMLQTIRRLQLFSLPDCLLQKAGLWLAGGTTLLRAADEQHGLCAASCSGLQTKSLTLKEHGIRRFTKVAL